MQKVAIQFAPQRMFTSTQQRISDLFFQVPCNSCDLPRSSGWASTCNLTIFSNLWIYLKKLEDPQVFVISCNWVFVFVCFGSKISTRFDRFGDLRSQQFLVCTSALACTALGTFVDCTSRTRATTGPRDGQRNMFQIFQTCSITILRDVYSIIFSKDSGKISFLSYRQDVYLLFWSV